MYMYIKSNSFPDFDSGINMIHPVVVVIVCNII